MLGTHTRVDVHWQDGREERGAPSTAFVPCEHLDDHDFWPDDFVEEKAVVDDLDEPGTFALSLLCPNVSGCRRRIALLVVAKLSMVRGHNTWLKNMMQETAVPAPGADGCFAG